MDSISMWSVGGIFEGFTASCTTSTWEEGTVQDREKNGIGQKKEWYRTDEGMVPGQKKERYRTKEGMVPGQKKEWYQDVLGYRTTGAEALLRSRK